MYSPAMAKLPPHLVEPMARFVGGATLIREAVTGIDLGALSHANADGWSIRDILVHLSDAEMVRATRIRLILASAEPPAIFDFDEANWKRRLHYLWRSPEAAIALFDQLRYTTFEITRQLDSASWDKVGVWPDGERVSIAELMIRGANHAEEHAGQIKAMRST